MFNIGFGEFAIIFIVLIIAVGPERLPSMMKTVGKGLRTLRQASRDLRESTGIDELLREDFSYVPPPRPAQPPAGPPQISRDATVVDPTSTPTTPLAPMALDPGAPAAPEPTAGATLPSDGPVTNGAPVAPVPPVAIPDAVAENADGSLPSDGPLAAPAPTASPVPEPAKPRET